MPRRVEAGVETDDSSASVKSAQMHTCSPPVATRLAYASVAFRKSLTMPFTLASSSYATATSSADSPASVSRLCASLCARLTATRKRPCSAMTHCTSCCKNTTSSFSRCVDV